MRRTMIIVACLALTAVAAAASPQLTADEEIHVYGEALNHSTAQHTFVLKNTGTSAVRISSVRTNLPCCARANLADNNLRPGETTDLQVSFMTRTYSVRQQPMEVTVTVSSNAPTLTLKLKVYVRATEADLKWGLGKGPQPDSTTTAPDTTDALEPTELFASHYYLIDVRDQRDYGRGHLLGAVNIPANRLLDSIDKLPRGVPIYLYDENGSQAIQMANALGNRGFRDVYALAGGLVDWHSEVGHALYDWTDISSIPTPRGTPYTGSRSVSPADLVAQYQVIIDLRPQQEFAAGHLFGAVNLSHDRVLGWARDVLPRPADLPAGAELTIWVIDSDGTQACTVAAELRQAGLAGAVCLEGGYKRWLEEYGDTLVWTP